MKRWSIIALAVMVIAGGVFWKREPLMLDAMARRTPSASLEERASLIAPALDIRLPDEGSAPFPVVMQLHGCAGIRRPFHHQWADIANAAGYAAVIVDSAGPRGFSRQKALEEICAGKQLIAQERAGDILAVFDIIKEDQRLDASRVILAGWSHGAWTAMDFLTMDMRAKRPAGLAADGLVRPDLIGAVLFYPHCGLGAWSRVRPWIAAPPVLAFVAGQDESVDGPACLRLFERRNGHGADIDVVFYEEGRHVFDDPYLEPEWLHLYNDELHKDAETRYAAFLAARLKSAE